MTTSAPSGPASFERVRAVADAVLYEGYLLYPYRRSSAKNRVRWQFGVVAPQRWLAAHGDLDDQSMAGSVEAAFQQTECLLRASVGARVHVRVRFLQLQRKQVSVLGPDGTWAAVDGVQVGDAALLSFDEAVPHERDLSLDLDGGREPIRIALMVPAGEEVETPDPQVRIVRRRDTISLIVEVSAHLLDSESGLWRLRVRAGNDHDIPPELDRNEALRHAALATHTLLTADGGRFVSLLDPPPEVADLARHCRNVHTYPVLAGDEGADPRYSDVLLSAPIILYDHPKLAPESPGDLHDATEIDEILSLRTLTLTEAEKREARATDPRAAAIVDRVDAMPPEVFERLHGAIRGLRATKPTWFDEDEQAPDPERDSVRVNGVTVRQGSLVRLQPRRRGGDPHDMFLDGRVARVNRVHQQVGGGVMVAVLLVGDPGADLAAGGLRHRYFTPEEISPLHPEA